MAASHRNQWRSGIAGLNGALKGGRNIDLTGPVRSRGTSDWRPSNQTPNATLTLTCLSDFFGVMNTNARDAIALLAVGSVAADGPAGPLELPPLRSSRTTDCASRKPIDTTKLVEIWSK